MLGMNTINNTTKGETMTETIKYNDGELILDDEGLMCAVGVTAHKAMKRIDAALDNMRKKKAKYNLLNEEEIEESLQKAVREIFEGINNCTIILGVG